MSHSHNKTGFFQDTFILIMSLFVIGAFLLVIILISWLITQESSKSNFAVLDAQALIAELTEKNIKLAKTPDDGKQLVTNTRNSIENWLSNRLETHCPNPCVVLNRQDVVYGDVIDLNNIIKQELNESR